MYIYFKIKNLLLRIIHFPEVIYSFKVNNGITRIMCEIRSKLNIKTPERCNPSGIYLFKVNNRNTRARCEICSKLTRKTPERRQWRRSGVFIVNFERISHLVLVFLLLTFKVNKKDTRTTPMASFWCLYC